MNITAYDIAQRFVGVRELPGEQDNPFVMSMLRLDAEWPEHDEVPWCSGFVNYVAWLLRLPRSKSLRARSWLRIGRPVPLSEARPGFDVVILSRGSGPQPGPDVIEAPGHVGFFGLVEPHGDPSLHGRIHVLGGNQSDSVNLTPYSADRLLGVRRLHG